MNKKLTEKPKLQTRTQRSYDEVRIGFHKITKGYEQIR